MIALKGKLNNKLKITTMNSKLKSISLLLMITIATAFQSCSSDDGIVENQNQLEDIQNRIEQYQESIGNMETPDEMEEYARSSQYASSASISFVSLQAQALAYSSVFLSIPGDAEQQSLVGKNGSNSGTWVWSYGGVTLYYTIRSDADFDFFEYDIEENGVRINLYKGRIKKDASFYEVEFNGENGEFLKITYTNTAGIINFTIEDNDNNRIELLYNEADQSGSIKIFDLGVLSESFIWSSNGTGSYVNHTTGETFSWP